MVLHTRGRVGSRRFFRKKASASKDAGAFLVYTASCSLAGEWAKRIFRVATVPPAPEHQQERKNVATAR